MLLQGYNSLQKTGGRTAAGGGTTFPSAASARLRALVGPNHPEAQSLRGEPAGADSFEALAFKVRAPGACPRRSGAAAGACNSPC